MIAEILASSAGKFALKICSLAVALAVVYGLGDIHGRSIEGAKWKAADLQAKLAASQMDADEAKKSRADAEAKAAAIAKTVTDLQTKVRAYEDELAKRPKTSACALTGADISRLRGIR
jgi:hypothetical protein